MIKIFLAISIAFTVACDSNNEVLTLNGEPLIRLGGGADAVVDTIDLPGLPSVGLSAGDGKVGIGIFQADTGSPYLTLGDTNNDGLFDMLEYYALSPEGKTLAVVEDFGMDGQPDFVINYEKNSASVFYEGAWLPVENIGSDKNPTIRIDGQEKELNDVLDVLGRKPF